MSVSMFRTPESRLTSNVQGFLSEKICFQECDDLASRTQDLHGQDSCLCSPIQKIGDRNQRSRGLYDAKLFVTWLRIGFLP